MTRFYKHVCKKMLIGHICINWMLIIQCMDCSCINASHSRPNQNKHTTACFQLIKTSLNSQRIVNNEFFSLLEISNEFKRNLF